MKLPLKVKLRIREIMLSHQMQGEAIKTVIIKPMVSFITARKEGKYSLTVCFDSYEAWYLLGPRGKIRLQERTG